VIFDDDSVDTIKESEIPRYFGDSNCGSAYVLYYQAVDLDLGALGLRTAAQRQPTLSAESAEASPNLSSQVLPTAGPSVNPEARTSETGLATASSTSSKPSPPSPITVNIPSASDVAPVPVPVPASPIASGAASSKSFLRHAVSLRGLGASKPQTTQAAPPPLPPIPTSPSTQPESSSTAIEPASPSIAAAPPPVTVGKSRAGLDWSSSWFSKRRSKVEKSQEIFPASPRQASQSASDKTSRPVTASSTEVGASQSFLVDNSLHPPAADEPKDTSPSASLLSSPAQLPSIPSTSSTPSYLKAAATHNLHAPDHKKSQPTFKTTPHPAFPLQRSATAGALPTIPNGHTSDISPPPVPSLPSDLRSPTILDKDIVAEPSSSTIPISASAMSHQPQQSLPPPTSTNNKRTSRKYSFTGSGLFGRRDKHKDNKDKDTYVSTNHNSVVPGVSILGRM
jgi:ubiquitin carboxyl-terminal hydrolase 9/13